MQAVCGQVSCTRGAAGQRPEQAGGQREASGRQHASEVTWQLVGPAVAAAANGTGSWCSLNGPTRISVNVSAHEAYSRLIPSHRKQLIHIHRIFGMQPMYHPVDGLPHSGCS